jgi:hypothetical protein
MRKNLLFTSLLLAVSSSLLAAQQLLISKPEDLAGRWETSDGNGGMVGMNVIVSTHVDGTPVNLIGHKQYLDDLEIGLYQRTEPDVEALGFSFSSTSSNDGAIWDGQQLRILAYPRGDLPKIDVSLFWDETKKQWDGHYERGEFSRQVTLKRPENANVSSFVGTWFDSKGLMNNCLHIAQQSDGGLPAGQMTFRFPDDGDMHKEIPHPPQSNEHYGEIAKSRLISQNLIMVELRAYTAGCCSHPFKSTISSDGNKPLG